VRHAARPTFAVVALLGLATADAYRPTVEAEARAAVVLATAVDAPVLAWTVRLLTPTPRVEETRVAGEAATVARPAHGRTWPALVFVNGATELGHRHPDVQRLVRGLARAGFVTVVSELPGLRRGEVTARTLAAAVAVARAVAARPDARGGRVALLGVSVGATLALLAAEQPDLRPRVTVVAGIAPYTNLREVTRLATTGVYAAGGRLLPYEHDDFVALAVARSYAAALPPGRDRRLLVRRLAEIPNQRRAPLARLRPPPGAGPATLALLRLLRNRDPARFTSLYGALPEEMRRAADRLSPLLGAARLTARVELATAPHDKYFPIEQSRALVRRARSARLTVTAALSHAIAQPTLRHVDDLVRLDGFAVRTLERAYRRH
jgi:dienelactone hydrolase